MLGGFVETGICPWNVERSFSFRQEDCGFLKREGGADNREKVMYDADAGVELAYEMDEVSSRGYGRGFGFFFGSAGRLRVPP